MWVLPTFDRPERVQKTLDSIASAESKTPGLVYLDGSKNSGYDHMRLPNGWSLWKSEENRGVCRVLNDIFTRYPNCPWYGFLSDDSIVRTTGWDLKLLSHLDDFGIVHSADGWQSGERIHGAVLFGKELLSALGWWTAPGLIHSFCDDVWEAIAQRIGRRRYVPEVLVEHIHFWNGKANIDTTYLKAYSSFDADQKVFQKWKEHDFENAISRIENRLRRL